MQLLKRYLTNQVLKDLEQKMVFIGGPRQIGKTTLAKTILGSNQAGYLSWDIPEQREAILKRELPDTKMWVFDEIHKYKNWRNYLKGIYDQFAKQREILVTGSARLDYYRRGGDSLQGRYHYLRLNPLSIAELKLSKQKDFDTLYNLNGFPEPFFSASDIETKRWSREYRQRLIQEDLINLENVKDLGTLELLMLRLPHLVGSPLSINALREDLQVSHKAVANWLNILERLYAIFRIAPFGSPLLRAIKKEQKHYHYDWSLIEEDGFRFENLVAVHLLKWIHFMQDTQASNLELRYFRDIDGREIDFIITDNTQPTIGIECKWNDANISKHLKYFKRKYPNCEMWQLSMSGKKDYLSTEGIHVCPALKYLMKLI